MANPSDSFAKGGAGEEGKVQWSQKGAVLKAWHLFPGSVLTCLLLELAYFAHDKLRAI